MNKCFTPEPKVAKITGRESVTSRIPKHKQPIKEVAVSERDSNCAPNETPEFKPWTILKYDPNFEKRFWARVEKSEGCWLWTGPVYGDSVTKYGVCDLEGKCRRVHQISWILANGPIASGMCICHHCDVPACVRPDHLYAGTSQDNSRDMRIRNRRRWEKLSLAIADDIRLRYQNGETVKQRFADEYGVSNWTIRAILKREIWNWDSDGYQKVEDQK